MIPEFNDRGYLPLGVRGATMDEIAERFGRPSELRRVQMESLRWLVDLARRAGVRRIVINGSFVTDVPEPNDVDCVLLIGPEFPLDESAGAELVKGLPYIEVAVVEQDDFDELAVFFATDRRMISKGMVEIMP